MRPNKDKSWFDEIIETLKYTHYRVECRRCYRTINRCDCIDVPVGERLIIHRTCEDCKKELVDIKDLQKELALMRGLLVNCKNWQMKLTPKVTYQQMEIAKQREEIEELYRVIDRIGSIF